MKSDSRLRVSQRSQAMAFQYLYSRMLPPQGLPFA